MLSAFTLYYILFFAKPIRKGVVKIPNKKQRSNLNDKEQLTSVAKNNAQNAKQSSYVEKAEAQPKDYEEIEY
jgi:hypothetical protein